MKIENQQDYSRLYEESINNPEKFWAERASELHWFHPWENVLDDSFEDADVAWFSGGRLNVSHNCIDRHLKAKADKPALIWEADEPGFGKTYTFKELKHEVCRIANVLKSRGVRKGDTVCLYMPMIPELAFSMLACSRIGAIHSVVFAGFSAEALRERVIDCGAKVLITANEGKRGGKVLALKSIVDKALYGTESIETVLVARRTSTPVPMKEGRDLWLDEEMEKERRSCPAEWMSAEDPLFVLYTSGSTGKPKGLMHTQAGYLLYAHLTFKHFFNYQDGDIHFYTADLGWITGHSYVIYGPLSNGATTILFESTPHYPGPARYWQTIDKYNANTFYTSPTAVRSLIKEGDHHLLPYKLSSLKIIGSVGEPINPEAWMWLFDKVGRKNCSVVDTWWQTETEGIMIAPLPGIIPFKAGSATLPFFGVKPLIVDDEGKILTEKNAKVNLCLAQSWPGMARTIFKDHKRYSESYFTQFKGLYFTGDGCFRDADGYYWITGRVDDVINVSGHRIGTAELESSLASNHLVNEAAVVAIPDNIKGSRIYAFVVLKDLKFIPDRDQLLGILKQQVRSDIGSFAAPENLLIVEALPKTRSGKVMRRILKKIAVGDYEEMGNISTLADPSVVDDIIELHKKQTG
jgi:acetyl-CoA synthetase